jgi:atypical dual specificity phosphatase
MGNDIHKSKNSDNKNDNINYLHVEVEDYKAPTIAELKSTTVFLENEIESNRRPVLVHCAAGKGRTGTILAAYLLKKEHMNAEEAIRKIRKLRPGSIQTQVQEEAIRQYASSLSTG